MKGFCECVMPRRLEASHETPSSLINNSVSAFLIPPMNAQQSILSHLTILPLFNLLVSITHIYFADRLIQTCIRDVPSSSMAEGETDTQSLSHQPMHSSPELLAQAGTKSLT